MKARLDEAWLESAEVPASTNPHFGTEPAWEVVRTNYVFVFSFAFHKKVSLKIQVKIVGSRGATEGAAKATCFCAR